MNAVALDATVVSESTQPLYCIVLIAEPYGENLKIAKLRKFDEVERGGRGGEGGAVRVRVRVVFWGGKSVYAECLITEPEFLRRHVCLEYRVRM